MLRTQVVHAFDNRDAAGKGRFFPGLAAPHASEAWVLSPQTARRFSLDTGDLISIAGIAVANPPRAVASTATSYPGLPLLGLAEGKSAIAHGYDDRELRAWFGARGIGEVPAGSMMNAGESDRLILAATGAVELWIILAVADQELVNGGPVGALDIRITRAKPPKLVLPEPLGDIRDEFVVTRGTARAYELAEDETVQIIDVEGQQCSDFMAFSAAALERGQQAMIDNTATRSMVRRSYPGPGLFDKFYDQHMTPMLRTLQDTCGRHDTFGLACTARGYEDRGFPGHVNCSDNISAALGPYGVARRSAWPAINFFWNTWIDPHSHHIQTEESWSRPGDYVALQAMAPLVCVSTACPDDIDPINGWNPTDIHVRIYRAEGKKILRAVAYREKEDGPVSLSQESAFHPATSKLTRDFVPRRNLWLPNSFTQAGTIAEYWACRDAVSLQDMSNLRKYDVIGPDAERLLQKALSRDVAKLPVWRGSYMLMCDAQGTVVDDGTLFRLAPQLFRWCCGTEESARQLTALIEAEGLDARVHAMGDALPNLALQGPASRDVLRKLIFTQPHVPALDDLKWFGVTTARLKDRAGLPLLLCRTGYTGELGYELFCAADQGPTLWDALMEAGEECGIKPMGAAALEILRIEAGFAAAGAEFAPGVDAFSAGLGFAVDLGKSDFVGKDALLRVNAGQHHVLKGLVLDQDDTPRHGALVYAGERPVGVVTSATRSPKLQRAIAMARIAIEKSVDGTTLEIGQMDGRMKRLTCTVTGLPFLDPKREKARA